MACALTTLLLSVSTAAPLHADHYLTHQRVLLLNSYHPGYSWSDQIEKTLRTELVRADATLDLSVEYLDTKRFKTEQVAPDLEQLFLTKYRQRPPDALIVSDDAALQFILPRRSLLFPGVPVVFCGINSFNDGMIAGQQQITGVAQDMDMAGTLGLILRLHPQSRHLAFISDSSETGWLNRQQFRQAIAPLRERVAVIELAELTVAELATALRQLPADSVILHTTIARDRNGTVLSPEGSIALITENTAAPFYGLLKHHIGNEGVGGIITSAALQGETVAALTLRILRGEAAASIPVLRNAPTRPMFNYPVLQRYHIKMADLPADSVILNRPFSFYESYKTLVWTVGLSLVLLASLVVALLLNIRSRRRATALLRQRKNQLQQVIESMPVGVCLADRHGKLIMANHAGIEIWGGAQQVGIDGYGVYKGWWAATGVAIAAEEWGMARAIRTGEASHEELIDIEAFDGARKTILHSAVPLRSGSGEIIAGLVVIQDVTERLRFEKLLAESEKTLRQLFDEMQNGFALHEIICTAEGTPHDYRFLMVNRAFERLTGLKAAEILGRTVREVIPGIDPMWIERYGQVALSGESTEFEAYVPQFGGHFGVRAYCPEPGKFAALFSDVSERIRGEQELENLLAELEQRNAELEQFTYSVSHDLKTPLVTISGFVGQLRNDLEEGNQDCLEIDLDFIENSTMQMSVLLENLLHLARSGRVIGDPQPVDLARIVRQAMELAGGVLGECTTRIELADDLPWVSGDADRLREVFQNLLENAAKFSRDRKPGQIEIGGKVDGDQVLCWVRDNGIGIAPNYLEKIFGLFEKLDKAAEGTGIGLALARRIVEKHGGRIWVESAGEGQGSTFYLSLPGVQPAPSFNA